MRYLRLWWQFVITAFVEQAEFRLNFALAVLGGWGGLGLAVLTFGLLYQFTNEVQGWTRDEALIFKVFDSDATKPSRFTAHSAFDDPNTPADASPRESIETRTFAFFD